MRPRAMSRAILAVPLLAVAAITLLPLWAMIATALQDTTSVRLSVGWEDVDLGNVIELFTRFGFGPALLTSIVVTLLACLMNIVVCSLAAYGFSIHRFRGSETLFWAYLATMMIPTQVTIIPLLLIMRELHLTGTYFSLAVPAVGAFGVFLIRQFSASLPYEVFEAARLDGAGPLQTFRHIYLPLVRPALGSLTIFTFISVWNDFLWPLVSLSDNTLQTVTLAAAMLPGRFTTDFGLVMAGAAVSMGVPVLAYLALQKQFLRGIAVTGSQR